MVILQEELEQIQTNGNRTLVLGNEAISYGLIDGGVKFVASYPGTPSTEIMEKLFLEKSPYCKPTWSANEAVAFEEAMAASISGVDSAFVCKSVGLNVAMDPLMTICNSGTNAAFLVIVADDPSMHSSQNEQDNRLVSL